MDRTIINPLSGRRIKVGKATYRKVMKLKSNIDELHHRSLGNKRQVLVRNRTERKSIF